VAADDSVVDICALLCITAELAKRPVAASLTPADD
jgi:hypothetical protein